jgi:hypothetical protein
VLTSQPVRACHFRNLICPWAGYGDEDTSNSAVQIIPICDYSVRIVSIVDLRKSATVSLRVFRFSSSAVESQTSLGGALPWWVVARAKSKCHGISLRSSRSADSWHFNPPSHAVFQSLYAPCFQTRPQGRVPTLYGGALSRLSDRGIADTRFRRLEVVGLRTLVHAKDSSSSSPHCSACSFPYNK